MPTSLDDKVDDLLQRTARIETALKYNGQGLIPAFEEHCKNDKEFRQDYYKFKRWAIGILCFLIGTGILGIGLSQVIGG